MNKSFPNIPPSFFKKTLNMACIVIQIGSLHFAYQGYFSQTAYGASIIRKAFAIMPLL
jgi:hypothetical protein